MQIAKIFMSFKKLGWRNTMTSDFRLEAEIWLFCAWKWKICNKTLIDFWPNCWNCRMLQEIWVEEHDCNIKFQTGSINMAVSCMHNENYAI